jgi:hypothetical protein
MDTPHPAPPPLPVDQSGTLIEDVPCRRCGYNLRGLHHESRCPECGTPIGLSVQGDLLRFADPRWVETLARGGRLIMLGLTLTILFSLCGGGAAGGFSVTTTVLVLSLLAMAANVLTYVGAWIITTPDPSRIGEDKYAGARKTVRITLLIALAYLVLSTLNDSGALPRSVSITIAVLGVPAGLAWVIYGLAYLRYLGRLSERIPEPRLTRRARQLFWASIVVGVLFALVAAAALALAFSAPGVPAAGAPVASGPSAPSDPNTLSVTFNSGVQVGPASTTIPAGGFGFGAFIGLACLGLVVWLVVFLLYVRLQHNFNRACREQAAIARATCAAAGPPI